MLEFLVSDGYGGSSASPGSGSNAPALIAQALLDQAVEEQAARRAAAAPERSWLR